MSYFSCNAKSMWKDHVKEWIFTKCSDIIHYAKKGLLRSAAAELYNAPLYAPLTLSTVKDRLQFNPLTLHPSLFSCARPCAHQPTFAGYMSTGGF